MKIWELAKAAWKDPVWSKLIATALGAAGLYLLSLWPQVRGWMVLGLSWAMKTTTVSNWLLLLMVAATGWLIVKLIRRLWPKRRTSASDAPRALTELETKIMRGLAVANDDYVYLLKMASALGVNKIAVEHAVDELEEMKLVHKAYFDSGTVCTLMERGRAYVVKQGYTS